MKPIYSKTTYCVVSQHSFSSWCVNNIQFCRLSNFEDFSFYEARKRTVPLNDNISKTIQHRDFIFVLFFMVFYILCNGVSFDVK